MAPPCSLRTKTSHGRLCRATKYPLPTATCEGVNSRIAAIQHRAAAYRNFARLRQAIFFYCGRLNLYP